MNNVYLFILHARKVIYISLTSFYLNKLNLNVLIPYLVTRVFTNSKKLKYIVFELLIIEFISFPK